MAYIDLKPYNDVSKWMSKNGGPQKSIELIETNNQLLGEKRGIDKGLLRGRFEGVGITLTIICAGLGIKRIWNLRKEKIEEEKLIKEQTRVAKASVMQELQKEKDNQ